MRASPFKNELKYDGPRNCFEQPEFENALDSQPVKEEWKQLLEDLFKSTLELLTKNDIEIINSSSRLKTQERMREKRAPGGSIAPILDIYGIRFILRDEKSIDHAVKIIRKKYPTPDKFPWEIPTYRKGSYSEHSHPDYNSTKINILFKDPNSQETKIAEIQFLTPEQEKIDRDTRGYYEKRRRKTI
jgi:hypothetical protein